MRAGFFPEEESRFEPPDSSSLAHPGRWRLQSFFPLRALARPLLRLWAAGLGVMVAGLAHGAERPNLLWLTSEDHGPEMGCYGDANARTPQVDALAARGMVFNRVWSVHPVCAPARTVIISGLYGTSSGGVHMRSMVPLPRGVKMFPQFLREAGYYATNQSKEDYNLVKPDGTWDDSSGEAHWRHRRQGQPFFAVLNSNRSHESQVIVRPHRLVTDPAKVRVPAYHPDVPEVRRDWAQYYDKVSEADADAWARLKELEEAGLTEDTIVFYYADHGSGMPRSKRWPSNSGLQVPLVVYFPEKWRHLAPKEYRPGGRSDRLVSFVDLAPTVLSLAGVAPPDWMQGHAFAGPWQTEFQPYLFGSRGRMDERVDVVRSVTDGRYVYVRNFFPQVSQGQHVQYQNLTPTTRVWRRLFDEGKTNEAQSIFWRVPKASEELYDLKSDRDAVHNLAGSPAHRVILEKLREAQRTHAREIRDVTFLPEGEMHARAQGGSPFDLARDEGRYPFERIYSAADLASNSEPEAMSRLAGLLNDPDSAVRYWAALGFLMRGSESVVRAQPALRQALEDPSPYVRIVAAETLVRFGAEADLAPSLDVLRALAPPDKNGPFVALAALAAIEALGPRGIPLHDFVRGLNPRGGEPHPRFNSYAGRLIARISGQAPLKSGD